MTLNNRLGLRRKVAAGAVVLGTFFGIGAVAAPVYGFSLTPSVVAAPSKTVTTTTPTTAASSGDISFNFTKILW